jgi:hypothetical protein
LDEATGQLGVELAVQWEADAELEVLWTLTAWVQDLVLDRADGSSSLTASLSMVVEWLEGRVDATAANGVCWGTRSALVAALSHFLEQEAKLEMPWPGRNVVLTEDQVDALWILACPASDLLESHVLPSVAHGPPHGARE